MSKAAAHDEPKPAGILALARKLDDAVFSVEKTIVAFALITITVVVFVDVIARRISAPDSKVGQLLSKIAGVDDFATREWVDANVAPWVTLALSLFMLGFGFYSARRFSRMRAGIEASAVNLGKEIGLASAFAAAGAGAGWTFAVVFDSLESWQVYAGTFGISAAALATYEALKKKDGWPQRIAANLAAGAVLIWVSVSYVPEGYTWSKKVSLLLLLWVGLLSASICVYAGKHIRMGAAQKLLPERARRWVNGAGFLATATFCALMTFLGFMYIVAPKASDDEFMTELMTLGGTRYVYGFEGMIGRGGLLEGTDIPDWLGILAAPVGFGIATFRFIGGAISAFLGGSYGESAAEEGMEEAKKLAEAVAAAEAKAKAKAKAEAKAKAKADDGAEEEE